MTTQALQDHILFQTGYLVNGIWKTLDTTFDVLNPATGEVIAKVAKAGKAQTEDAIAAATQAFPAWRAKTAKERSAILYRWYELIIENKSWLGRLMTTEQVCRHTLLLKKTRAATDLPTSLSPCPAFMPTVWL